MLHHVELNVSNLTASKQFWSPLLSELGYTLFQSWDKGCSWKSGDTYLVFTQTEEKYQHPPYHRRRTGLNHLAFHATSRKQVDDMTRALEEKGINILYKDRHPFAGGSNYYAVFFEDPDRIKVELVAPDKREE
ncbi:VOC family protein [Shouchella lonarensis]|uniref:Catechol 2,3-dioxygenase n=1 Tax=Shouchella lonarensis TaxID=1464122 RepID=A0A1G6PAD6_9BACI|nr:VOC family protein [Shouchella lonarensis]SDC77240.1 Catechol 2,3-dioxygenase [Shouchella lonarensis]